MRSNQNFAVASFRPAKFPAQQYRVGREVIIPKKTEEPYEWSTEYFRCEAEQAKRKRQQQERRHLGQADRIFALDRRLSRVTRPQNTKVTTEELWSKYQHQY